LHHIPRSHFIFCYIRFTYSAYHQKLYMNVDINNRSRSDWYVCIFVYIIILYFEFNCNLYVITQFLLRIHHFCLWCGSHFRIYQRWQTLKPPCNRNRFSWCTCNNRCSRCLFTQYSSFRIYPKYVKISGFKMIMKEISWSKSGEVIAPTVVGVGLGSEISYAIILDFFHRVRKVHF